MDRSPENLFSQAARAVANLTKYGAHNIYETIGDITQHLADCDAILKDGLVTGIPFVLVWKCADTGLEVVNKNCSRAELDWLYRNLISEDELVRKIDGLLTAAGTSSVIKLPANSPDLKESFKTRSFAPGGTCLNFRLSQRGGNSGKREQLQFPYIVVSVFYPGPHSETVKKFGADYEDRFLATLYTEVDLPQLLNANNGEARQVSGNLSLPETQSSFRFLQETLEEVLGRIQARLSDAPLSSREKFVATFLFRTTTKRSGHSQQYRYIFTRSQIKDLRGAKLSTIRVGKETILKSFMRLKAIRKLTLRDQATVERWLSFQEEKISLHDLLTSGHWYGDKSFVTYVGTASPNQSMYISDWRIWYSPEQLYRMPKEKTELKKWLAEEHQTFGSDPRTEPLDRLLRSEVEQHYFGLKSMFLIPIYGNRGEPSAIVQISAPEGLPPAERIRNLQIVGFVYNEILGYLRADVLQEKLRERAQYDQFVDLAHLFTHAGTKLISTPMHNTLRRFDNAIRYGRFTLADQIDKWSIADGLFTTKTLETTLGILTRFEWMDERKSKGSDSAPSPLGTVGHDINKRLMAQGIQWDRVELELTAFLETAFFRHFWNVCHDPEHKDFCAYFAQGQIVPSEMIRLDFALPTGLPTCLGHTDLVVMHLSNLVENAIEAFDLLKSAIRWKENGNLSPLWRIACQLHYEEKILPDRKEAWVVLSVANNSSPTRKEAALLQGLNKVFLELGSRASNAFLGEYRDQMRHRAFTSKSGGSHGWALLEFASYLRRLEIRQGSEVLQNGTISVNHGPKDVLFQIRFPLMINANESAYFLEYSEDGTL